MRNFFQILIFSFLITACSSSKDDKVSVSRNDDNNDSSNQNNNNNLGVGTTDSNIISIEKKAFDLVNAYRASQGLGALTLNNTVSNVCRAHSVDMANNTVPFGHAGFANVRVPQLQSALSISTAAENVAFNQGFPDPAQTAVSGWINSPGHQQNMVGNFTSAGMGVAISSTGAYYFTQIFVK